MHGRDHGRFPKSLPGAMSLALLSACASTAYGPPPELSGTRWAVTSIDGSSTSGRGADLTADFGVDGRINGDSGCNNYSGPYIQTGETVRIGELLSTRRACVDDARQRQEARMLRILQGANTVEREGDGRISLRSQSGSVVLAPLTSSPSTRAGRLLLDCQGVALTVAFEADNAELTWSGGQDVLEQRPASSGAYYQSPTSSLRITDDYIWTRDGSAPRDCREVR